MDDPPENRPAPLEYARPETDGRRPGAGQIVMAVLCLLVGIPLVGMAIPIIVLDILQQFFEPAAVMFLLVGGGLCWLGMFLKSYRPADDGPE